MNNFFLSNLLAFCLIVIAASLLKVALDARDRVHHPPRIEDDPFSEARREREASALCELETGVAPFSPLPSAPMLAGIRDVDEMEGVAFEKFLKNLFERQGYTVELTAYYDLGADLVLCRDNVKTAVQAKRHAPSNQVSIDAVRAVVASKAVYDCTEAMVVTNSRFTPQAITLARANQVTLWDRDVLTAQLPGAPISTTLAVPAPVPSVPTACVCCGEPVSERVAAFCQDNYQRFDGRIYCLEHQAEFLREPRRSLHQASGSSHERTSPSTAG